MGVADRVTLPFWHASFFCRLEQPTPAIIRSVAIRAYKFCVVIEGGAPQSLQYHVKCISSRIISPSYCSRGTWPNLVL
jgi:hypothetical protein